jgi:hypothetical protein
MAIIIVEGGTAQGKSTLVKDLSAALQLPSVKENKPTVPGFQYYLSRAKEISDAVFDRFLIGESVYPILYEDGRVPLERWQQHMIERCLLIKGTILIHAFSEPEFRKQRYLERGDPDVPLERLVEEAELFLEPIDQSLLSPINYNMAFERRDEFIDQISEIAKTIDAEEDRKSLHRFEGTGSFQKGSIMLVGERYGDGSYVGTGNKALSVHHGCSAYLHRALDSIDKELGHDIQGRFYITNAVKYEDRSKNYSAFHEEMRILEPQVIIALGDEASAFLRSAGVKHTKVYHPQFMFRFHNRDINDYTTMIIGAIKNGR